MVASLFSLYGSSPTPDVNESHYLTKARHFWDPSFAAGDIFLESSDAHWFYFATVGSLTAFCSLPMAAWIGRILGWLAMAFAWTTFIRSIWDGRFAGSLAAPFWLACLHWGHLSGEWILGGGEAKVWAYAAAFVGLAWVVQGRTAKAWPWFGLASAFHVLTGGWITLVVLARTVSVAIWKRLRSRTRDRLDQVAGESMVSQGVGLMAGGCLALLGLVPALSLNRHIDAATAEQGAIIYVYQRLPHHLSPLHFAGERWLAFAGMIAIPLSLISLMFWRLPNGRSVYAELSTEKQKALAIWCQLTGGATALAIIGFLIDWGFSGWATNWSASLLRYYWFRWNDVAWPTLAAMVVLTWASKDCPNVSFAPIRWLAIGLLAIPGPVLLMQRYATHLNDPLSPADRASMVFRHETQRERERVRQDWLDVCFWVRSNTEPSALFLTPRFQQTFKWYAHRSEVACWKDSPQDAPGLIEWEKRMLDVYPRSADGYGIPMSDEHLLEMHRRYRLDYVILDRRIQKTPPFFRLLHANRTYAVFEFP